MTTPAPASSVSRRVRIFFLLGFAAAIALLLDAAIDRIYFAHPTHDQAWYLYAAGLVLSGTKLYGPRLTDVDPPCIIWFSMLPRLVASWLHIAPLAAMKLVVTAMMVASAAWSARILRLTGALRSTAAAWLTFAAVLAIEGSQAANFGQREHLLIILLVPYILLAVGGPATALPLPERIAAGVAAGAAICFKPQDTLIVIGLEIFLLIWHSRLTPRWPRLLFRPDLLALVLTACVYNLLIWLLTPLYLHQNLPLLLDTYWAFGEHTFAYMLRQTTTFELAAMLTLLLWIYRRRSLRVPLAPLGLLVASLSAFLAYCLQRTGFGYQAFPQNALLAGAILWLVCNCFASAITVWAARRGVSLEQGQPSPEQEKPLPRQPSPGRLAALIAVLVAVSLPGALIYGHRRAAGAPEDNPFLEHVLASQPPGTHVYVLSTALMGFDHIFKHNLVWGGRYAHLWMLPSIAQNEAAEAGHYKPAKVLSPARVAQLAQWQRANTAADLATWKPSLVLVERCTLPNRCQAIENLNFDILAWFLQSPDFAAQWSHYRRTGGNPQYDVYTRVD